MYSFYDTITHKQIQNSVSMISDADFANCQLTLDDDISEHIEWISDHCLRKPYPGNDNGKYNRKQSQDTGPTTTISRPIHGVQHACRTAANIVIFANLYLCYYGYPADLMISAEDLKVLQIVAGYHDLGREDDDGDTPESECRSATNCYLYLTRVLKLDHERAKRFAELIPNKEVKGNSFYELIIKDGKIHWRKKYNNDFNPYAQDFYRSLLHDADCLEMLRATMHFDGLYLEFDQRVAINNPQAYKVLAELIAEMRSVVNQQGDLHRYSKKATKQRYENTGKITCYSRTVVDYLNHPVINCFYANNQIVQISQIPLQQKFYHIIDRDNLIIARGIHAPGAIREINHPTKPNETLAETEFRKVNRTSGNQTRSKKSNNTSKHGSPNRSGTLFVGPATPTCAPVFCLYKVSLNDIVDISDTDSGTGFVKKNQANIIPMNDDDKKYALSDLMQKQMLGGSGSNSSHDPTRYNYNEVVFHAHASQMYGIGFTEDPCSFYDEKFHPKSAIILAHYTQLVAQKELQREVLLFRILMD